MHVPRRTTPWASVALSSPASSPSSSSRGKKTGSARGAHRVTAVEVQYRALSRWANPAAVAAAWLQLPATRRTARSVSLRLSCHFSRGAALHNVAERLRLQLLHRFETASSISAKVAFGWALRHSANSCATAWLAACHPGRICSTSSPFIDHSGHPISSRSLTLPDYAKLRRAPVGDWPLDR